MPSSIPYPLHVFWLFFMIAVFTAEEVATVVASRLGPTFTDIKQAIDRVARSSSSSAPGSQSEEMAKQGNFVDWGEIQQNYLA
jgi:hypothetical protein